MAVSEADAIAETQAGSSVYYLFQDNGNLTERVKEASMSGPTFVGTAKPNTPAALLVSGDKVCAEPAFQRCREAQAVSH